MTSPAAHAARKRTLTTTIIVFAVASVVFFASFLALERAEDGAGIPLAFLPFALATVVSVGCLVVLYEDLKRRNLSAVERRWWVVSALFIPWAAVAAYWWRFPRTDPEK
jgi:hypothetical protein